MLGCGCSTAVPKLSCLVKKAKCEVCTTHTVKPKNVRGTPSIVLRKVFDEERRGGRKDFVILVDCGKTFKESASRLFPLHDIRAVDAVLLTHFHTDAIIGLDDLREIQGAYPLPVFCDLRTLQSLRGCFPYIFPPDGGKRDEKMFVANCSVTLISDMVPFKIGDLEVVPLPMHHGDVMSYGFLFNYGGSKQFAYFSDFRCVSMTGGSDLVEADFDAFSLFHDPVGSIAFMQRKPFSYIVLDCLSTSKQYRTHANLHETLSLINSFKKVGIVARESYLLTGMGCSIDYDNITEYLTSKHERMAACYDGMAFSI